MARRKPEARERATAILLDPISRDQANRAIARRVGVGAQIIRSLRAKLELQGAIPARVPMDMPGRGWKPISRARLVAILGDPVQGGRSSRSIAEEVGVAIRTVQRNRKQLADSPTPRSTR